LKQEPSPCQAWPIQNSLLPGSKKQNHDKHNKGSAHLHTMLPAQELKSTTKYLVENELEDLLTRTLTGEQKTLLEEGIIAYQAEDYETALEKVWTISNQ